MRELKEIKDLICTVKYAKHELLENMLQEQNFKVHLRPNQKDSTTPIEDLLD